jgi:uncharacterized protein (DUF58 family)
LKLTRRGKDYLQAVLLIVFILGVTGPSIALALAFAMSVMAAISGLVFWASSRRTTASLAPMRLRFFKQDSKTTLLSLLRVSPSWVRLESVSFSSHRGLTASLSEKEGTPTQREVVLTALLAGRLEGATVTFQLSDLLGMFLKTVSVRFEDFRVESLPLSLKAPLAPVIVSSLVAGEVPVGRGGFGQELYALGEYHSGVDARDIHWKRLARTTDDTIPVRVREANVPRSISIGIVIRRVQGAPLEQRMDLVSEALGRIGKELLSIGTSVEVSYLINEVDFFFGRATKMSELADLTVGLWTRPPNRSTLETLVTSSDIAIIGTEEVADRTFVLRPRWMPTLVISESPLAYHLPDGVFGFTGRENLTRVTLAVLSH